MNDAFFYEDMPAEDKPFCPPLRHDDDPEPFFRDSGQPLYLDSDGRIVDGEGKPTYWFSEKDGLPLNPQPRFASEMDAAVALMLDDDAFYVGHCFISVDWRRYVCR